VSTEHESAPARPSAQQPLLPVDGVMLALLAVAMIYGAVTGGREQLAVRRAYLRRAENVGRSRRCPDERDRDHECEGAHPPAR